MKRGNRRTNHSLNSIFDSLDSEEIYLSSKEANHDLLSFQEEVDLFRKASNGDIEAKNKIILQNQKLVMSVAYKYRRSGSNLEFMDLIQYGNIGLLEAIKRFEVNRGLRFSTYAQYWIKAIIQRNSTKNRSPFSISERAGDSIRVVNNAISQLSQCLGREPTNDEIAATLGISQKKLSDINILRSKPISLNQSIPGNDKGSSLYEDIIKQPNEHSIENKLIGNELDAALKTAIKKLKPDLQKIINLRFGFVDGEPKSFEEIGQIMGKSREVIRIKEKKALLFISSFLK